MTKSKGWVSVHRSLTDSPLWLDEKFTRGQAWVDLICLARHKPGYARIKGVRINLKRGELCWSELGLGKRWKWSRGKVRRFMEEMENDDQIVQLKSHVTSIITIVNYHSYQSGGTTDDTTGSTTGGTTGGTTDGQQTVQQTDMNNNGNKDNNEKKGNKENSPPPEKEKETDILKKAINDLNELDQEPSSTMEPDDPEYDRGIEVETPRSKQIANNALLLTNCFLSLFTGTVAKRTTVARHMRALLESVTMTPGDIEEYMYRKQREDGNTVKIFDLVSEIQEMCGVGGKGKSKKGVDHSVLKKFMESQ